MNGRAIRAIVRKDVQVALQNKGVTVPLIVVPLVLLVLMPLLAALVSLLPAEVSLTSTAEMRQFLDQMPAELHAALAAYNPEQQIVVMMLVYFFALLYLILPLMVASVIAADSFAGEKERKTLEALLYTPTTNMELLLGKLLAAWLPAVAVSWIGFILYGVAANVATWPLLGELLFPNWLWIVLALWVAPAAAGFGLSTMVLVSLRAQGFQDAYQLGGLVVVGRASGAADHRTGNGCVVPQPGAGAAAGTGIVGNRWCAAVGGQPPLSPQRVDCAAVMRSRTCCQ